MSSGTSLSAVPCIISQLCSSHDGLEVEAKGIKEHHFKAYIKRIGAEKGLLLGVPADDDNFIGVLDLNCFEKNRYTVHVYVRFVFCSALLSCRIHWIPFDTMPCLCMVWVLLIVKL